MWDKKVRPSAIRCAAWDGVQIKFNWKYMLSSSLLTLLELAITAYSRPVRLSVGAVLSMKSSACELNTKAKVVNFNIPPNTYTMCLCHRWRKIRRFLKNRVRTMQRKVLIICPVLLESYSIAGFHRHNNEHKNYAIVSSDEGHCLLTSIRNKEGGNEREGALINKLCDGQWDKTSLTDSNRCFHSSSFSMIIFIQSQLSSTRLCLWEQNQTDLMIDSYSP